MAINAKYVRLKAPAGTVVNFQGITGKNHKQLWISTDLIKVLLDKKVKVYEFIPKKVDVDEATGEVTVTEEDKEIILDEDNYTTDNGGKELTDSDVVVIDLEKERHDKMKEIEASNLELRNQEILKLTEQMAKDYLATKETL